MGVATAPSCTGAAHGSKLSLKRSGPHTQHVWEVGVTLSKTPRLQDLDVLHIDAVLGGAIGCQQVDLSRCSRRTSSLLRVPHHLASKKTELGGFKENGGRSNAKCLARMTMLWKPGLLYSWGSCPVT